MLAPILIKVGGHEIGDPEFLTAFSSAVSGLNQPAVIVHGGGKEIAALQEKFDIEPRYTDGVRITDAISLSIVEMVLCGEVNKRLVRYLINAGVDALGLSGVDRGIVRAEKMQHPEIDMQFTGVVASVRGEALSSLLQQGVTPVLAPICQGEGSSFNVNADHVAGAVAVAIGAQRVVFLTNVPGVLQDGQLLETLTSHQAKELMQTGVIYGGMIPKVNTALHTLELGVHEVMITNLQGLKENSGTVFSS